MKFFIFCICTLSLLLVSCESEEARNRRLSKNYDKLNNEHHRLKEDLQKLHEKQNKIWFSLAKERFSDLLEIQSYSNKPLEDKNYIKKISLVKKSEELYNVTVSMRALGKIKPKFIVFLLNRRGLIIGEYYHKRPFFKGLPVGQTTEKSQDVKVSEEPYYFRVEVIL